MYYKVTIICAAFGPVFLAILVNGSFTYIFKISSSCVASVLLLQLCTTMFIAN